MSSTESGFVNLRSGEEAADDGSICYNDLVESTRKTFLSGKTKSMAWRKQQLAQMRKMFVENHEAITEAILKDHGGPKLRGVFDITSTTAELDMFEKNLDSWAKDEPVKHDSFLGKSYVRREPKGVVLIIAPWNFPFAMVFDPLVPIIAAGNCAIIKPSEVSVNSCALMAELIPKYFDNSAIKVVTGAVPETTALLKERFDHIMYTGNGAVGRIVMKAASKYLTPVTLELGGKSPTYVDKSAKIDTAVERVFMSKFVNCGQICIAPDYILVHKDLANAFKTKFVEKVKKIYGDTAEKREKNSFYPNVINGRHVQRINKLVTESSGKILLGGNSNSEAKFLEPTIIDSPSYDDSVLKEEIFGPVLPIVEVSGVEEAAEKVNLVCSSPLALYIFAEDQKVIDYFLNNTTSGGVAINSTLEHQANHNLPFGGVGDSGLGKYHGKWGFDEFSHHRAVLVRDTKIFKGAALPPPPYNENLYNLAIKLKVTGFLTPGQKSALKVAGVGAVAAAGYFFMQSKL